MGEERGWEKRGKYKMEEREGMTVEDTRGVRERERERWQGGRGRGRAQGWGVYVGGWGGVFSYNNKKLIGQ